MNTLSISMRPQKLEDVIGSTAVVASIRKQIASGRIPTGWFFTGPSGTGKTTLARIVARLVQGETFPADWDVDLHEENAADNGKVADARRFAEEAEFMPRQGKYRVVIMDEMQQATPEAQNVFLKLLEDTCCRTIFVFCTTNPSKIIPALKSRCLSFVLSGLTDGDLRKLVHTAIGKLAGSLFFQLPGGPETERLFADLLIKKDIRSPRDILMCVERFASGMSGEEATQLDEDKPEYAEIASAVVSGDWPKARALLRTLRSGDAKGLRSIVAFFLADALLTGESGSMKDDAFSIALMRLQNNSFEDGINLRSTIGLLYHISKQIKESRKP